MRDDSSIWRRVLYMPHRPVVESSPFMPQHPFYSSKPWKEARAKHLRLYPHCEICAAIGLRVRAVEVDHRRAIEAGGQPLDPGNFSSKCKFHHSQKTRVLDTPGQPGRDSLVTTGPDGFPVITERRYHGKK